MSVFLVIVCSIFILDLLTKRSVARYLEPVGSIQVFGDWFRLTYVENTGAAFGILRGKKMLLVVLSLIAVIWIVWYYRETVSTALVEPVSLAMVVGGALGNLYDRVRNGYVVDFFDMGWGRHRWPAFNIADMAISISIVIWIGFSFYKDFRESHRKKSEGKVEDECTQ